MKSHTKLKPNCLRPLETVFRYVLRKTPGNDVEISQTVVVSNALDGFLKRLNREFRLTKNEKVVAISISGFSCLWNRTQGRRYRKIFIATFDDCENNVYYCTLFLHSRILWTLKTFDKRAFSTVRHRLHIRLTKANNNNYKPMVLRKWLRHACRSHLGFIRPRHATPTTKTRRIDVCLITKSHVGRSVASTKQPRVAMMPSFGVRFE